MWYRYKCETVRTYTDDMPAKLPIEDNEEFKSIRNAVVSAARDIHIPREQPERDINYDYESLIEHKNDFDFLYNYVGFHEDAICYNRLGRYYLEHTDDMENAEYWLRMAAEKGNSVSSYLIYKAYRDKLFDEKPSDKMEFLRLATDSEFAYAEYEYAKYLKNKFPEKAKEYLERAAAHGSFQAEYALGKMLFDEGKRDEARKWFELAAKEDDWTQTRVGLLLYNEYEDYDKGMKLIKASADNGYKPAKEIFKAMNHGINLEIAIGLCDLFCDVGGIIENKTNEMYQGDHQVNYHGIDRKLRKEIRAKKNAHGYTMSM